MKNLHKEINLDVLNWLVDHGKIPSTFVVKANLDKSVPKPKLITRDLVKDIYSELRDDIKEIVDRYHKKPKSVIITGLDTLDKDRLAVLLLLYHAHNNMKVGYYSHPNFEKYEVTPITAIMRLDTCSPYTITRTQSHLTELVTSGRLFITSCKDGPSVNEKFTGSFMNLLMTSSMVVETGGTE